MSSFSVGIYVLGLALLHSGTQHIQTASDFVLATFYFLHYYRGLCSANRACRLSFDVYIFKACFCTLMELYFQTVRLNLMGESTVW